MDRRRELALGEAERAAECDRMDAPLVLCAGPRAGSQYQQLPFAWLEPGMAEDAGPERPHARGQLIVDGERAEQAQWLDVVAGRHPLRQQRGRVGLIGRLEGGDPGSSHWAVLLLALLRYRKHSMGCFCFRSKEERRTQLGRPHRAFVRRRVIVR